MNIHYRSTTILKDLETTALMWGLSPDPQTRPPQPLTPKPKRQTLSDQASQHVQPVAASDHLPKLAHPHRRGVAKASTAHARCGTLRNQRAGVEDLGPAFLETSVCSSGTPPRGMVRLKRLALDLFVVEFPKTWKPTNRKGLVFLLFCLPQNQRYKTFGLF